MPSPHILVQLGVLRQKGTSSTEPVSRTFDGGARRVFWWLQGGTGGPVGFKRQRTRQDLVETTVIAITAVTLLVVPRALQSRNSMPILKKQKLRLVLPKAIMGLN